MRFSPGATMAVEDWRRAASPQARAGSVGILARQEALRGLDANDLEAIARASRPRSWEAGAGIYRRGDDSRELILIAEGRVRLSVLAASGSTLSLRHAGPGTMIGEVGVLGGGDRLDDATATTAVEALTIPRPEVDRLLAEYPPIARALIGALCDRIRAATEQLESVALYSVEARLARLLLGFAREADKGSDGRLRLPPHAIRGRRPDRRQPPQGQPGLLPPGRIMGHPPRRQGHPLRHRAPRRPRESDLIPAPGDRISVQQASAGTACTRTGQLSVCLSLLF